MSKLRIDLTGGTFGLLTVIARAECPDDKASRKKKFSHWWACKCVCGVEGVKEGRYLMSGATKSCGCYQREVASRNISAVHAEHALTDDKIEKIKAIILAGGSNTDAKIATGVCYERAVAIRTSLGLPRYTTKGKPKKTNGEVSWTDDKIQRLRDLDGRGIAASEIGRQLGFTRNAVLGKRTRLGLEKRPTPIRARTIIPAQTVLQFPEPRPLPQKPLPVSLVPLWAPMPIPKSRVCEWIDGHDRKTWAQCTSPSSGGTSWCSEHRKICIVQRKKAA